MPSAGRGQGQSRLWRSRNRSGHLQSAKRPKRDRATRSGQSPGQPWVTGQDRTGANPGRAVGQTGMSDWIALQGDRHPHCGRDGMAPVRSGALVVELAAIPALPSVMLTASRSGEAPPGEIAPGDLWAGEVPPEFGIALTAGRAEGVAFRVRIGGVVVRHSLPGPMPGAAGPVMVVLSWTGAGVAAPDGRWRLGVFGPDNSPLVPPVSGLGALALHPGDGWLACRPGRHRVAHAAVSFVGLRRGRCLAPEPPEVLAHRVAVSANLSVEAPDGARPAGLLRPGQAVLDAGGRAVRLAALHLAEVPLGMSLSPLRLRAGHFGTARDVVAGPGALVAVQGDEVEFRLGAARAAVPVGFMPRPRVQPVDGLARSLLMALPVPERPAIVRIGGLDLVLPGPDGDLPDGIRRLGRAEVADLTSLHVPGGGRLFG